jgi:hypothetical protein
MCEAQGAYLCMCVLCLSVQMYVLKNLIKYVVCLRPTGTYA